MPGGWGVGQHVGLAADPRRHGVGAGDGLLHRLAQHVVGHPSDGRRHRLVGPPGSGAHRRQALDAEGDVQRLISRRGSGNLEVVAGGHPARVGGQVEPVAVLRLAAQEHLVVAVGVHVDVVVIEHPAGAGGVLAVGGAQLHGERRVDRPGQVAGDPVGQIAQHRGLEVHRVGVVAGELAGGRHDAPPHRPLGVELGVGVQARLENVQHQAVAVGDVLVARHPPFLAAEAVAHLRQSVNHRRPRGLSLGLGCHFYLPLLLSAGRYRSTPTCPPSTKPSLPVGRVEP